VEDVLTYAMFPKVAPDFFKKRDQGPVKFTAEPEAPKAAAPAAAPSAGQAAKYVVNVNGADYTVVVRPEGTMAIAPAGTAPAAPAAAPAPSAGGHVVEAPVAGTIIKYAVNEGASVTAGQTVMIIESMKMELEIKATGSGTIHFLVSTGTQVAAHQPVAELK